MNFRSNYIELKHENFTVEDIKKALKDLERFREQFESVLEREKDLD
jgi:hypothetical protein